MSRRQVTITDVLLYELEQWEREHENEEATMTTDGARDEQPTGEPMWGPREKPTRQVGMTPDEVRATCGAAIDAGFPDVQVLPDCLDAKGNMTFMVTVCWEYGRLSGGGHTTRIPHTVEDWKHAKERYDQNARHIEAHDARTAARAAASGDSAVVFFSASQVWAEVQALREENALLRAEAQNYRAELENLVAAADATHVETQPYAGVGHTKIVGPFPAALAHARRLLADQPESEARTHDSK